MILKFSAADNLLSTFCEVSSCPLVTSRLFSSPSDYQTSSTMFGGMNFFHDVPRPFKTQYRCNSVSMMPGSEREELEQGGKIILPPSALDQLTRLNIVYPMLFKLTNTEVRFIMT